MEYSKKNFKTKKTVVGLQYGPLHVKIAKVQSPILFMVLASQKVTFFGT